MLLHRPVRSDPTNNIHRTEEIIPAVLRQPPVRLIVFYQEEPVGEICLIKRSDAKSDINHGKVETPASCQTGSVRERKSDPGRSDR